VRNVAWKTGSQPHAVFPVQEIFTCIFCGTASSMGREVPCRRAQCCAPGSAETCWQRPCDVRIAGVLRRHVLWLSCDVGQRWRRHGEPNGDRRCAVSGTTACVRGLRRRRIHRRGDRLGVAFDIAVPAHARAPAMRLEFWGMDRAALPRTCASDACAALAERP